jgi:hypothetical protein
MSFKCVAVVFLLFLFTLEGLSDVMNNTNEIERLATADFKNIAQMTGWNVSAVLPHLVHVKWIGLCAFALALSRLYSIPLTVYFFLTRGALLHTHGITVYTKFTTGKWSEVLTGITSFNSPAAYLLINGSILFLLLSTLCCKGKKGCSTGSC